MKNQNKPLTIWVTPVTESRLLQRAGAARSRSALVALMLTRYEAFVRDCAPILPLTTWMLLREATTGPGTAAPGRRWPLSIMGLVEEWQIDGLPAIVRSGLERLGRDDKAGPALVALLADLSGPERLALIDILERLAQTPLEAGETAQALKAWRIPCASSS